MPRPKGLPKTGGRDKGTPNQSTQALHAFLDYLANGAADRYLQLLMQSADEDFMEKFERLLEYVAPKLQRSEVKADINNIQAKIGLIYDNLESQPDIPDSEPEQG